ncbi:hypothetical protein AB1Y20_013313 [Prymnesium parvum]|uniref:4a-hydroxytetrahydrobiopterin dehydratase n=1 Tax=Prymnesium parvum TaxID=97485 RepID=A0AB34INY4_PRYPA
MPPHTLPLLLAFLAPCTALKLSVQLGRREAVAAAAAAAVLPRSASAGLKPCPGGANNCWSTAGPGKNELAKWAFPAGASKSAAAASLREVVEAYPQAGQAGVDLGGWALADGSLADGTYARYEFKSGIGNFAKFFNGGKPFVDDLELSVEDGFACVRSSSRVGDSDLGVNAKRINYIAAGLRAKGWDAPGVPQ